MSQKVEFRDYSKYPVKIMNAARFRDEYDELPDGAFFAIAEEQCLYDALIEMAEWEHKNTNYNDNRRHEQ